MPVKEYYNTMNILCFAKWPLGADVFRYMGICRGIQTLPYCSIIGQKVKICSPTYHENVTGG